MKRSIVQQFLAVSIVVGSALAATLVPSQPASGAPAYSTLVAAVTPLTSGTAPFDLAANCSPALQVGVSDVIPVSANVTGQSHCPSMDMSGDPTVDRIVRTMDTIDIRINWSISNVPATSGYSIGGVNADTNVVVQSTLPLGTQGLPAAVWLAIPTGCYTSSTGTPAVTPLSSVSNSSRTLTCNLGHRSTGSIGNITATLQTRGNAGDGQQLDIIATMYSATTKAAVVPDAASAPQTFWSSAAPRYNLKLDSATMQSKFPVYGPAHELGRLMILGAVVPSARGQETLLASSWAGGNSVPTGTPLSLDIDMSAFSSVAAADGNGTIGGRSVLYTWGRSGNGCGSAGGASAAPNAAPLLNDFYWGVTGAGGSNAKVKCAQVGGAGGNIHIDAFGADSSLSGAPPAIWGGWVAIWIPVAAIPATPPSVLARVSHFDPQSMPSANFPNGQSNFGGSGELCSLVAVGGNNPVNCEPGLVISASQTAHTAANDNEGYGSVVLAAASSSQTGMFLLDQDVRAGSNVGVLATEPTSPGTTGISYGHGYSDSNLQVRSGETFLSSVSIGNNGGGVNSAAATCNKWDNRTLTLTDFGDLTNPVAATQGNPSYTASTWAVVNTSGTLPDVWHPKNGWNRSAPFNVTTPHNLQADPAYYALEFGAGEYDPYTPAPTAPAQLAMRNATCRNQDSPAGWFTNPLDPAIQAWIDATYGAGSGIAPKDVVNKARIRLLDPLGPDSYVDMAVRLTARSTFGPTAPMPLKNTAIPYGTRLAAQGAYTDSILASRSGAQYINGWWVGTYDPGTDGGAVGDRMSLSGLDTRERVYSLWNSPVGLNGTPTVIAGQDVWWRVDTTAFSLIQRLPAGQPAYPLRSVTVVPASLTYVPGTGCKIAPTYVPTTPCATRMDPASVIANADGTTTLVWDIGNVVATNAGLMVSVIFRTTTDPLTNSGTLAAVQSLSESVNSNGTSNDRYPACQNATVARTNRAIPITGYGPAETLAIPTVQCDTGAYNYRLGMQPVTINNAASYAVSGRVAAQQIEVNDADDGTGTKVAYTITAKNFDTAAVPDSDVIMVLPFVGDARIPSSAFSGTLGLQGVSTTDVTAATANPLPTSSGAVPNQPAGTTFYFTSALPNTINGDAWTSSNLASGATKWCLQNQFGSSGCPTTMANATAVRAISGSLAGAGTTRAYTLRFASTSNRSGDIYTFRAAVRASKFVLLNTMPDTSMQVTESQIGDTVWEDTNGNGVLDSNETGRFSGVRLQLRDVKGTVIASTVTDTNGAYLFAGLHSGSYSVRVVLSNGVDGLNDRYPAYSPSFDLDNGIAGGADGDPDAQTAVVLGRGQPRGDVDFGFFAGSIGGVAWNDTNKNGLRDSAETVAANVSIGLFGIEVGGAVLTRSVLTAADGSYSFVGLRAGAYALTAGPLPPSSAVGVLGSGFGSVSGATVSSIALGTGAALTGYNFSIRGPSISGTIYVDIDGDGKQTAADQAISSVNVSLSVPGGANPPSITTTLTDPAGRFNF